MVRRRSPAMAASSFLVAILLILQQALVAAQKGPSWLTLSGDRPLIVARGGFSGLFPDSSLTAYQFALSVSSSDVALWCDVQLTKDGVGICLPDLKLNNCTDIERFFSKEKNEYSVNGANTTGWFTVDYTWADLQPVSLIQAIYSRSYRFDSLYPIITVGYLKTKTQPPPALWLNIQHDAFYKQQGLSMTNYLLSVSKNITVEFLSSPEVNFLRGIAKSFSNTSTKLIFRFLDKEIEEPTMKQTYGSLLKNLTFIKTFASGILVPKTYIWPVSSDNYLLPHTTIVADAHKAGLEIYAADLVNDNLFSFNYSYDPLAEVLSYVDNGNFSVDGVVSDYPITPSEAIGCFANLNKSSFDHGKPYIFSHNGDSGDYPDCTDLSYQGAVAGGADFIDCTVQVTQDNVAICMSSIDLIPITTVAQSNFRTRQSVIPEIQSKAGVFTYNLTWEEIQTLKPLISDPGFALYVVRNPRYKNAGKFLTLSDFLSFAKGKSLAGVVIKIEYAAFIAEKLGYSVVDAVISSLEEAGYNNQTGLQILIQSTNSSVLVQFKQETKYKLIYEIDEEISNAASASVTDIKKFASAVAIDKGSIFPDSSYFIVEQTDIVATLQKAGLEVYVQVLRNEFVDQPLDFFSDATTQINSYVAGAGIDGIITDFPASSRAYKRNSCMNLKNKPPYMLPVQPGGLLSVLATQALPPALAPMPILEVSDVVEPPLPLLNNTVPHSSEGNSAPTLQPASAFRQAASWFISLTMTVFCGLLLLA